MINNLSYSEIFESLLQVPGDLHASCLDCLKVFCFDPEFLKFD